MNSIHDILEPYAELEKSVIRTMKEMFGGLCGMCTACCCRADICEEAAASPFLSLLLQRQGLDKDDMDDRFGWLDSDGCTLEYGKPPVCHAYFCDELAARLPDDDARLVMRTLGNLMDHVGGNAVGQRHLADIMSHDDLEKVPVEMLADRIEEAQAALEVVESYFHSGKLDTDDRSILLDIRGVEY